MNSRFKLAVAAASIFLIGLVSGQALAGQPHMRNALNALNNAADQLPRAEADKGGHRAKAMTLVSQAQAEVRAGINFAK